MRKFRPRRIFGLRMPADMPAAEFRRHAHALVDAVADRLEHPERRRVRPDVRPGAVRSSLSRDESAATFEEIFSEFERIVEPALTQWNHPGFLAYFPNTGSYPAVLAELLATSLNVNGMIWSSSPGASELEEAATDLLRRLLGLPDPLFGQITDTASTSTLYALAAAREAAVPGTRDRGLRADPGAGFAVYCSSEAHSSVDKAVATLGLGLSCIRRIPTDDEFSLKPDHLAAALIADREAGVKPLAVIATVGTTSTTAIDPVRAIAAICAREKTWLHIDAAYAGPAAVIPEMRWAMAGWELADSLVVNPHKWLFVPMDCSVLFTRRPEMLRAAFSLPRDYIPTGDGDVINLMDHGLALGRRFRALKLWFVLRYFGSDGLAERLREHINLAAEFAQWIDGSPQFERLAPAPFSTVVFRAVGGDELNARVLERVNASGEVLLSQTRVHGRLALRLAIGNIRTTALHIRRAWQLLGQAVDAEASTPRSRTVETS